MQELYDRERKEWDRQLRAHHLYVYKNPEYE